MRLGRPRPALIRSDLGQCLRSRAQAQSNPDSEGPSIFDSGYQGLLPARRRAPAALHRRTARWLEEERLARRGPRHRHRSARRCGPGLTLGLRGPRGAPGGRYIAARPGAGAVFGAVSRPHQWRQSARAIKGEPEHGAVWRLHRVLTGGPGHHHPILEGLPSGTVREPRPPPPPPRLLRLTPYAGLDPRTREPAAMMPGFRVASEKRSASSGPTHQVANQRPHRGYRGRLVFALLDCAHGALPTTTPSAYGASFFTSAPFVDAKAHNHRLVGAVLDRLGRLPAASSRVSAPPSRRSARRSTGTPSATLAAARCAFGELVGATKRHQREVWRLACVTASRSLRRGGSSTTRGQSMPAAAASRQSTSSPYARMGCSSRTRTIGHGRARADGRAALEGLLGVMDAAAQRTLAGALNGDASPRGR